MIWVNIHNAFLDQCLGNTLLSEGNIPLGINYKANEEAMGVPTAPAPWTTINKAAWRHINHDLILGIN